MAAMTNTKTAAADLLASREAADAVWELGAVLPAEVVAKIYAETMRDFGLAAGLRPKAVAQPPADSSAGPSCAPER